jgi:hypothetical protein
MDIDNWKRRSQAAQAQAAHAYARLLGLAETYESGQARIIARFLAGTYNGSAHPFDLGELREVDVAIGDDMLVCLDALRWGLADLHKLVPNGEERVQALIRLSELGSAGG